MTVPYFVRGTAASDGSDHNLCLTSVNASACKLEALVATITEPLISGELPEVVIPFTTVDDGAGGEIEEIIITLGTPDNAVLGPNTKHTIKIVEGNVAPLVSLSATQLQVDFTSDPVSVFAVVTDANDGDTLSYDWSSTDGALLANITFGIAGVVSFDPNDLPPGYYTLRVVVDDGTATGESELVFNMLSSLPVLDNAADSDGDGINDETEGYGDADSDGIADYLDAIQAGNVIQILPGTSDGFLIQTEPGLKLSLGETAFKADNGSSIVTQIEISEFFKGNAAEDEIGNVGGYFDFTVSGLPVAGQSVQVVIPQLAQMPRVPVYRKLTPSGWQDFVKDDKNSVASAAGEEGYCPPPGHADYKLGLSQGHWCLQLTIEDGGLNDNDRLANNRVTDPGGVGRILTDVSVSSSGGGGGAWNPLMPVLSIFIMLTLRNKKRIEKKAA